jgi:hypothetical protein
VLSVVATATVIWLSTGLAAASTWTAGLTASNSGESHTQAVPSAPTGISAVCAATRGEVTVTWDTTAHAASYTLYDSTTSATGTYSSLATGIATTSYTTGVLTSGKNYWFEVVVYLGTQWASAKSTVSHERQINILGLCS